MNLRLRFIVMLMLSVLLFSCQEDPKNKFGGPSDARDTATSRRDTSSVGTRTDGH